MAAMAEIPRNRRRWVLPAELVLVGVLMMVIGSFRQGDYASAVWLELGSALALVGPLYGVPADAGAGSTERVPPVFVMRHRRAGE
jgi:drug/metabolite transporter (DMT)-like permease